MIDLEPEILCTGHFDPIEGRDTIRTELTRVRDAVQYVNDATVAGMNEGKDVFTLMRDIRLPDELAVGEGYGKVSWGVRSIWEGYAGLVPRPLDDRAVPVTTGLGLARGRGDGRWSGRHRQCRSRARRIGRRHRRGPPLRDGARGGAGPPRRPRDVHRRARGAPRRAHGPTERTENFWLVGWLNHQIATAQEQLEA